jgi:hypothetical protein
MEELESDLEVVEPEKKGVSTQQQQQQQQHQLMLVVVCMLVAPNSCADQPNVYAGGKKGKKRGRPEDPIHKYFKKQVFDKSQGRWSVSCTLCQDGDLKASQASLDGLRKHLQKCKGATPEIRQQLEQQSAAKVNKQAAAAAAAAAAGAGPKRRNSTSSSQKSSGSSRQQMTIGHYSAGSLQNVLLPGQRTTANQHLLRALVTGGVPLRVSSGVVRHSCQLKTVHLQAGLLACLLTLAWMLVSMHCCSLMICHNTPSIQKCTL